MGLLSLASVLSLKILNLFLFSAVLGLHCCPSAFCSCSECGLSAVAVRGLLVAVASLAVEHRLQDARASVAVADGLSCP